MSEMDHLMLARTAVEMGDYLEGGVANPMYQKATALALIDIAGSLRKLAGAVEPDVEGLPAVRMVSRYVERKRARMGPTEMPADDGPGVGRAP